MISSASQYPTFSSSAMESTTRISIANYPLLGRSTNLMDSARPLGPKPRTSKARSKLRATGRERCRRARSARRDRFLDCLLQQPAPTSLALAQSLYGPSQISARQPDPRRFPLVTIASRFIARSPGRQRLVLLIGPQRHSLVQLRFTSFAVTSSRGTSTRESAPMLGPRRKKGQDKS